MSIKLSYGEKKAGWWVEPDSLLPIAFSKDGQICKLSVEDALGFMNAHYPHRKHHGPRVWYFNETLDREIAEQQGDEIFANPQVYWEHLKPRENLP